MTTKAERLAQVHEDALADFDAIQEALRDERLMCLSDRRFYLIAGAQWEGPLGDQFENKPKFEMNKVLMAVTRVVDEYRNNRVTVVFTPKDGETNAKTAEVCNGLYRADEQDSVADEAYDNAFEEAAAGGFGAWRMRTCYEDEEDDDNDKQRIVIEPIFDADSSVFFDLDAKRQDKADAKRCYVLTSMSPAAYREKYNDDPAAWPKTIKMSEFDWCTPDVVYVCELYKVEETSELVHIFRGLDDEDMKVSAQELEDDPEKLDTLLATGFREVRQKRIKRRRVHKYIMSGSKILADEGYIAGRYIPVIPVYGKRAFVDNIERCQGVVRPAKDAQRLKNMQVSNLGLLAAQSAREKPIFTPEQMSGHAMTWADDNVKDYPYLLVNALRDAEGNQQAAGPIGYTKPPSIPPAMAGLLQITEQDMQDMLGNQQVAEQAQPNMSGLAVELVQTRLDMRAFLYMSNFKKGVQHGGVVWLSMMKDIAVEEGRKMKTVDSQNKVSSVDINVPAYNKETGEQYTENDLSAANFDVNAQVGPSSISRRAATVRALTGMMQISQDPETLSVLGAMAMMNMEGEGIEDVREFFRNKLLRAGAVKPTDDEAQQLQAEAQNAKPSAQDQYLLAASQEAEAGAASKRADTVETIASADLKRAQTAKTMAETMGEHNQQQIASVQALQQVLAGQQNQGGMAPPDPSASFQP